MLGDLVADVVLSVVGEAVVEFLFPGRSKPQPPPEGEWNASLGSLAAFLAGIATTFCGLSTLAVIRGVREPFVVGFLSGSMVLAIASGALAHHALKVSSRRRVLAKVGLWLSRATVITGVITALIIAVAIAKR